jgi:hypothetical protein
MVVVERIVDNKSDEEWKRQQYEICRRKGTELPFSGEYIHSKEKGIYKCVCCDNELLIYMCFSFRYSETLQEMNALVFSHEFMKIF